MITDLLKICHKIARDKGFWDVERNDGELIALMHSELSEALEGLRKGDWKNVSEEMADTVIRIFDFCYARDIDLEKDILGKIKVNKKRTYKHGKKF